jgi:hypothetical protein
MLRTIWGDNERYLRTYWEKFQGRFYVAGDSAHRDKDGCFWIMGRIDDVLNVAGHRLGTMEIESALVAHPRIAEAAVVGRPHEIKGEAVSAFVVCRGARPGAEAAALAKELRDWVGEQLGAIAKPDDIRFADNLPKTRSGKIMRRLLRAVARGDEITEDISTLENPAIIDQLRGPPAGAGPVASAAKSAAKSRTTAVPESKTRRAAQPKSKVGATSHRKAKTKAKAKAKAKARAKAKAKGATKPALKGRVPARRKAKVQGKASVRPRSPTTAKAKAKAASSKRRARPARGK